jgi:hypothetical protein
MRACAHTPVPFGIEKRKDGNIEIVAGGDGAVLATVYGDDGEPLCWPVLANAEFIVRACNAHDELLAACESAVEAFGSPDDCGSCGQCSMCLCRAAIKKAKGKA